MSPANDPGKAKPTAPSQPSSGGTSSPASGGSTGRGGFLPWVVVLVVVAGVFIGLILKKHVSPPAPPTPPVETVAPVTNPPPEAQVTNTAPATNPPAPPPLKLQGVVADPARPWAIVNGVTVHVGDRVGEFRVREIAPNTITLEDTNGSRKTLFLGK